MTVKQGIAINIDDSPVVIGEHIQQPSTSRSGDTSTMAVTEQEYLTTGPGGQVLQQQQQHQNNDGQEKLGARCCGFCCDMRRAVIILNTIDLALQIIGVVSYLLGYNLTASDSTDDTFYQELENAYSLSVITIGIDFAVKIVTIVGANRYNMFLVGVGAFWLIGIFITNVVIGLTTWRNVEEEHDGLEPLSGLQICIIFMLQGVITMLYLYPHVGLMLEIKKGIMTPETYPREEFSCCCV